MRKEVMISVCGTQGYEDGAEPEKVELLSRGIFYLKDGKYYILYDETELTGMAGTKTTIKAEADKVAIIRKGTVSATLTFLPQNTHASVYMTEFGPINIETYTRSLDCNLTENGGTVSIKYDVNSNNVYASTNTLKIEVRC